MSSRVSDDAKCDYCNARVTKSQVEKLLGALGLTLVEFELTSAEFDLNPKEWLEKRLRALGWENFLHFLQQ